ncbi:hypothetical protein ZEAMMB73_Zm00001d044733 [Zea mays]|uniref:Uncharacterized protein n=1 Tax=Zea mays TaxID=4577 RepID=A0A1D6NR04_MAIZE|nr:hypothetical protein ZEAMMB73_Zm00001d044733 [Zea mays]
MAETMSTQVQKSKNHHQLALPISFSVTCFAIFVLSFVYWLSYYLLQMVLSFTSNGNYLSLCSISTLHVKYT